MKFLGFDIDLAIFDLDGTLIDSTSIWGKIDEAFFARRGQPIPKDYAQAISHIGLSAAATYTRVHYFPNEKDEDIIAEWHQMSLDAYAHDIPLKDGARELLEAFKQKGIPMAIATANSPSLYMPALERLGIRKYFSFMVDATICHEGKNSSRIYDLAAEHFGVAPENTVVFEDSLRPMEEATRGGYKVIGIYDEHSTTDEDKHRQSCIYFASSFNELLSLIEE